ncbi:hypothetical protein [Halosimplex amylolyticum]|uniref:hypothetical protein n=1 Tax=Halosimplex amylolyticum TaxID=3396616 RepID=UPI003F576BD5
MKLKLVAVFASVLLIATGAAMAMPGNAPDQAQDDNAQADDHARDGANESDANGSAADAEADDAANESDAADESDDRQGPPSDVPAAGAADAANGSQGPPVDLPEQVPDFVSTVHEAIGNHVGGAVDGAQSLGEQISALTPDDDAANETASDAGNATATAAP